MEGDYGIVTLVQCRAGSSRLKGKALKALAGRPMLDHVLERARAIGFPVVLATTVDSKDDRVAKLGKKARVGVFRGDEHDVLGRMSEAARIAQARIVIRVTGDCPLLAPDLALDVLRRYIKCGPGTLATNDTVKSGWPDGMDVEVFEADSLHEAAANAESTRDREHVTPWLRDRLHRDVLARPGTKAPRIKLSVDTQADFDRVTAVYSYLEAGELGWEATFAAALKVEAEAKKKRTTTKKAVAA